MFITPEFINKHNVMLITPEFILPESNVHSHAVVLSLNELKTHRIEIDLRPGR